jgi:hypothetical protein
LPVPYGFLRRTSVNGARTRRAREVVPVEEHPLELDEELSPLPAVMARGTRSAQLSMMRRTVSPTTWMVSPSCSVMSTHALP